MNVYMYMLRVCVCVCARVNVRCTCMYVTSMHTCPCMRLGVTHKKIARMCVFVHMSRDVSNNFNDNACT